MLPRIKERTKAKTKLKNMKISHDGAGSFSSVFRLLVSRARKPKMRMTTDPKTTIEEESEGCKYRKENPNSQTSMTNSAHGTNTLAHMPRKFNLRRGILRGFVFSDGHASVCLAAAGGNQDPSPLVFMPGTAGVVP
jgi:hypothetical protein